MRKYRLVSKKGEGTFSEVLKAQNVKRGTYHAIKCMRNHFESIDQVNTLREIQALRRLSPHPHIITLEEVLYDQPTGRLALVFELMDQNLYEVIRGRRHYLSPQLTKIYIYQLLKGLEHMHRKGIFHRDIKVSSSSSSSSLLLLLLLLSLFFHYYVCLLCYYFGFFFPLRISVYTVHKQCTSSAQAVHKQCTSSACIILVIY